MSEKALDPDTGIEVYATDYIDRKDYKCCNPVCKAILHIRRGNSPHFAALQSKPHIDGCPFSKKHDRSRLYLPEGTTVDEIIFQIMNRTYIKLVHKPGSNKIKYANKPILPNTPRLLYQFCLMDSDYYEQYCIDINTDCEKLLNFALSGISGYKVICGKVKNFKKEKEFVLNIQHKTHEKRFLNVLLEMNSDVYNDIEEKIFSKHNNIVGTKIIIVGDCKVESKEFNYTGKKEPLNVNTVINVFSATQIYVF